VKDPKERLTATQCKEHPWVKGDILTDKKQLSINVDKLRAWKAQAKKLPEEASKSTARDDSVESSD